MRALKIAAWTIGGLLGLLIVAAAVVAVMFDPNDYKDYAQSWVEERTGRSLTIDGDIELSLFPWLAVQTGHVELGNAEGFGDAPFVSAQSVSARVRLLPLLLDRELQIGTISIDGLDLDLATLADGTTNWADLIAPADGSADADSGNDAAARQRDGLGGLDIEGIRLRGSRIVWREVGAPRYIVSELSLSTGAIAPDAAIDLNLETELLDVATQRAGWVSLTTTAQVDADGSISAARSNVDFRVGDSAGNLDAEGTAAIETLEFVAGERLRTGPVTLSNDLASPLDAGSQLASELRWSALEADLANLTVTVTDLEAAANDVRARLQLVGENLAGNDATVRGSIVIDAAPAASALQLSGLTLPDDVNAQDLGDFSASTAFTIALSSQDIELSNLEFSMLGVQLRAQQAALRGNNVSARIDVTPFRPSANLRRIVAPWVPAGVDIEPVGSISLTAAVEGTPERLDLTDVRLAALGAQLTGRARIEDRGAGVEVSGNVASDSFAADEMIAVFGALIPESISAAATGTVSLAGAFDWNGAAGSAGIRDAQLEAFGMRGTGNVDVAGAGDALEVSGDVQFAQFDPKALLSRFSLNVPQTSDASALSAATVRTRFYASPAAANFEDLAVRIDQSNITGSFVVTDFENPMYRFTLAADRLDVDRYLPPQSPPGADDDASAGEPRRAGDIELSNDALAALDIDANVRVGTLRLAGMDFSNVATSIVVGDGRMLLDSAHAQLYGGEFDGSFHVDASTDLPSMRLRGSTTGLDLAPLITALAGSASFSGTARFDIDLTGSGPTVTDNLRSAAGTLGFELQNGAIDGFNVDKTLCRAFNAARGNPAPRDLPDTSRYEFIRGTATVTDGIAASDDLSAKIGSAEIRGRGTLALADQTVDYDFEARLARAVGIAGCEEMERIVGHDFPLEVTGPLTAPDIEPDYSEVIRRIIEYRIRENVRDRILESIFD